MFPSIYSSPATQVQTFTVVMKSTMGRNKETIDAATFQNLDLVKEVQNECISGEFSS